MKSSRSLGPPKMVIQLEAGRNRQRFKVRQNEGLFHDPIEIKTGSPIATGFEFEYAVWIGVTGIGTPLISPKVGNN